MSCTTVYEIYKTKASAIKELRNSHGSGPAIWNYISLKCTGKKFQWYPEEETKKFWPLWKSPLLNDSERAVLLCTYDMGYVEINKLYEFSAACFELHKKIIGKTDWTWSHFEAIGNEAVGLYAKHDHRCLGLGVGCTSVSDPWEFWKPKDDKAWRVYETIDALHSATDEEKEKL